MSKLLFALSFLAMLALGCYSEAFAAHHNSGQKLRDAMAPNMSQLDHLDR